MLILNGNCNWGEKQPKEEMMKKSHIFCGAGTPFYPSFWELVHRRLGNRPELVFLSWESAGQGALSQHWVVAVASFPTGKQTLFLKLPRRGLNEGDRFCRHVSSLIHGFLNGSQRSLHTGVFALRGVLYRLSPSVLALLFKVFSKSNWNFIIILKLSQPVQRASVQEGKRRELSGRLCFSDCCIKICGLVQLLPPVFLNYS